MKDKALKTAGGIFLAIALLHLSRVIFRFSVQLEGNEIPVWLNVVAFAVMLALSIWMFRAAK